jgi:predicted transcriptional regulator
MSESVTVQLPDELARQIRAVADQTRRPLEEALLEWLRHAAADTPVDALPDEQALALADMQMDEREQDELSALLAVSARGISTRTDAAVWRRSCAVIAQT